MKPPPPSVLERDEILGRIQCGLERAATILNGFTPGRIAAEMKEGGDPVTPREVYEGKIRPQLPRWQAWARDAKKKLDELRERPAA